LVITVVVTASLIRVSTCGRSTIVLTFDTKTCVLTTLRRVHSEVPASTRLTALTRISRPATKRRIVSSFTSDERARAPGGQHPHPADSTRAWSGGPPGLITPGG
jgi:hypothetical protein